MAVKFSFDLPTLRLGLYAALGFFSFFVFVMSAARLSYTTHLNKNDTLNGGVPFHDPIVAELLFISLVTMPWCGFAMYSIHKRYENRYISKFRDEMAILSFIWLFWIIGTGVATRNWGNLSFCQHFNACRVLTALVAFSWLGWLALTGLLAINLLFTIANNSFMEPMHGRWDPRQTVYA